MNRSSGRSGSSNSRANRGYQRTSSKDTSSDLGGFWAIVSYSFDNLVKKPLQTAWATLSEDRKPNLDGFKSTRRHQPDYQILLFMGLLMMIGLIIMYAIGPQRANVLNNTYGTDFYSDSFFFSKQLLMVGVSLAVFFMMSKMPIDFVYKHAGKVLLLGYAMSALLVVLAAVNAPMASCQLGACRWFKVTDSISFQPSELLKVGILVALSVFLGAKAAAGKINDFKETLLPTIMLIAIAMVFIAIFQKDLGTAISALAIIAAQLVLAGLSFKNIGRLTALMIVLVLGMIVVAPHRMARLTTFGSEDCSQLSAVENASDWHICHAKIAIGSGGLTGVGIGNSIQATGYLPEAVNDSVFAIMGETFGFVGLVVILLLFSALALRILRITAFVKDPASRIFAAGAFGWLMIHVVVNISAMIGLVPLTGITLPLLSYGGTSMMFISAVLGFVFNLSKYTTHSKVDDFKEGSSENSSSRRRVGRTRYTSSRRI